MAYRSFLSSSLAAVVVTTSVLAQDPTPLATARQQAFGETVTKVAGRVTVANQFRNTAYIQDGTAGIAIFGGNFRSVVKIGDSVVIERAVLTEFQATSGQVGTGLTELTGDFAFTVIPVPSVEPTPRTASVLRIAGPSGEEYEGQLVQLNNVRFVQTGSFQGETNYQVQDAFQNTVDIRIDGGTEIAINNLPIPTEPINLRGVVSQFRGTYQILPRFATDVSLSAVEADTVSRSRTLDCSTWNLDWLGADDTRGPADKDRQFRGVRQVMDSIGADLYAVQEVLSDEALARVSDSLAGSYSRSFAADVPSDQKLGYIYRTETIRPVSTGLTAVGSGDAWANGRFPYRMTFDAVIDGKTKRFVAFTVHAKATDSATAMEDYDRRKADFEVFHTYLNTFYADSNVIVLGDFNDDSKFSVVDSAKASPFAAFLDDASWNVTTAPLSERGLSSFIGGQRRSFLDHIAIRASLSPTLHRTYVEAPTAYISSYTATVSDHVPVTLRLFADGVTSVTTSEYGDNAGIRISPNPMSTDGVVEVTSVTGTPVSIDVVDATGRMVSVIHHGPTSAPTQIVGVPASRLATGSYLLRIAIDGRVSVRPFVVVH